MTIIFISYSRKDTSTAKRVVNKLTKIGFDVRLDQEDIEGGADWQGWIETAISESDGVIVLWSKDSAASEWVRREIQFASAQGKRIIPVLLDGTPLKNMILSSAQAVDGSGRKLNDAIDEVARVFVAQTGGTAPQNVPPVQQQARSFSIFSLIRDWGKEITVAVVAGLILAFLLGQIPFQNQTASPTPTPTLTSTQTLEPSMTFTPTLTITPTVGVTEGVVTNTPPPVPSIIEPFSIDSYNAWRSANGYAQVTRSSTLQGMAEAHLSRIKSGISLLSITAEPTQAYLDSQGQTIQRVAGLRGYPNPNSVVLEIAIDRNLPSLEDIIARLSAIGGENVHRNATQIGFVVDSSAATELQYLVVILGNS